jgi:hypothetical protein
VATAGSTFRRIFIVAILGSVYSFLRLIASLLRLITTTLGGGTFWRLFVHTLFRLIVTPIPPVASGRRCTLLLLVAVFLVVIVVVPAVVVVGGTVGSCGWAVLVRLLVVRLRLVVLLWLPLVIEVSWCQTPAALLGGAVTLLRGTAVASPYSLARKQTHTHTY